MPSLIPTSKTSRAIISAVAGFLAYGGWAYFANMAYGVTAGLKAACTQGSFSFVLTLIMNGIMEWLFHLIPGRVSRLICTILITCIMVYSASWGINYLAGTPEILMTVLPGWFFSTLYIVSYTFALTKISKQTPSA